MPTSRRTYMRLRDHYYEVLAERSECQRRAGRLESELDVSREETRNLAEQLAATQEALEDARRRQPTPPSHRETEALKRTMSQLADRLTFLQEQNDLLSRERVDAAGILAPQHPVRGEPGVNRW